jgi:hypothetical protein
MNPFGKWIVKFLGSAQKHGFRRVFLGFLVFLILGGEVQLGVDVRMPTGLRSRPFQFERLYFGAGKGRRGEQRHEDHRAKCRHARTEQSPLPHLSALL